MSPKSSPRLGSVNTTAAATPTSQEKKLRDKRRLQFQPQGVASTDSLHQQNVSSSATSNAGVTKPLYRHSISCVSGLGASSGTGDTGDAGAGGNSGMISSKRRSSFASPSSSFARRRSFLSPSMISNENHTAYQLHSGTGYNTPAFSISLTESQGFSWNQDLFASQYQQQSSAIYDDDEESEDDEIQENENSPYSQQRYTNRSLSMSNDHGYKVRVIDIKIDENESILQVDT